MKNQETKQEQSNWYIIVDSMGRNTDNYIIASNIKDAYKAAETKRKAGEIKVSAYYRLKRCYNGGVRGSVLN